MLKTCSRCGVEKDRESCFYKSRHEQDGYCYDCKACRAKDDKKRHAKRNSPGHPNYEKIKEQEKKIRKKNRNHLKRWYGITAQQFDDLLLSQGNACAICATTNPTRWHLDHDHVTKKVRGVLCLKCNVSIGILNDDPVLVDKAAKYLFFHQG